MDVSVERLRKTNEKSDPGKTMTRPRIEPITYECKSIATSSRFSVKGTDTKLFFNFVSWKRQDGEAKR